MLAMYQQFANSSKLEQDIEADYYQIDLVF